MPTIDQLSQANSVSDSDEVLLSQGGTARKATRAELLAGVQPQLSLPAGTLLGRSSTGVGAPETLAIGVNLTLNAGTLSASSGPLSIAALPAGAPPAAGDLLPIGQGGANRAISVAQLTAGLQPQISLQPGVLIGRSSTGAGGPQPVAIGANLTLSGGSLSALAAPFVVAQLPAAAVPAASDVVALGQGGTNKAATVAQLTAGLQPQISVGSGMLLGRNSPGSGGPEPVVVGGSLQLNGGTLSSTVTPFSIAQLGPGGTPSGSDLLPVSQGGVNKAVPLSQVTAGLQPLLSVPSATLLGRHSAGAGTPEPLSVGSNLQLANGTLSGTVAPFSISALPGASQVVATDVVSIGQSGTNKAATVAVLTAGMQPQLTVASGSLLGRSSPGTGGPQSITLGQNLLLANGTLSSTAVPFQIPVLTSAAGVGDADLLPISQNGVTLKATRAQLVTGLQPQITVGSGSLLGRSSAGAGAPEAIALGSNLSLASGTLSASASPFSIGALPTAASVGAGDFLPVSQNGTIVRATQTQITGGLQSQLSLPSGAVLGRSSAGTGSPETVTIGGGLTLGSGTLAATPLEALAAATAPSPSDLLLLRQGGTSHSVSFQTLMGGISSLPGIDGSHLTVSPTGATTAQPLATRYAQEYDVRDFGCVGDGSTDDTAALQAAINAAEAVGHSLRIPPGTFLVSTLTIAGSLRVRGAGGGVTVLQSKVGTAAPMFQIRLTPSHSFDRRRPVEIESLSLLGNKTDAAGQQIAHGIDFQNAASSPRYDWVALRHVQIAQFAGNGINAVSWSGYATLTNCVIFNNAFDNVSTNTCFDWIFLGCDIGQAGQDCVSLSGCGEFSFTGCAIYAALRYGVILYDINIASNTFVGCSIDTNAQGGVRYANPGQGHNAFINCNFDYNGSTASPGVYSDVYVTSNAGRGLCLIANRFEMTSTDAPGVGTAKFNIEFQSSTSPTVTFIGNALIGSQFAGSHFTSDSSKLVVSGDASFGTTLLGGSAGWQWQVNAAPVMSVQPGNLTLTNAGNSSAAFVDGSQAANFRRFAINGGSQQLQFFSQNDDMTAHAVNLVLDRSGQVAMGGGYTTGSLLVLLSPATSGGSTNRVAIIGAAGGNSPLIAANGTDPAVALRLAGQGGGGVQVGAAGDRLGFAGATPVAVPTVTGSRAGNAALTSLLTQLAATGLILDHSIT